MTGVWHEPSKSMPLTQTDRDSFARAYLACGYLLGARDSELPSTLALSPKVALLQKLLRDPDQKLRAQALARELSALYAESLEQRLK